MAEQNEPATTAAAGPPQSLARAEVIGGVLGFGILLTGLGFALFWAASVIDADCLVRLGTAIWSYIAPILECLRGA